MVREFLNLFSPGTVLGGMPPKLHMQAVALLHGSRVVFREEQSAQKEGAQVRFRRLSYAEEQAKWEWEHNKAAREAYQRQKDGFF